MANISETAAVNRCGDSIQWCNSTTQDLVSSDIDKTAR